MYIGLHCVSWAALGTVGCCVYLGLGRARASGVANATCSHPPITSGHRSGAPNLRSPSSGWPLHMSSLASESLPFGFGPYLASYSCLFPLCVTPKSPHHLFNPTFCALVVYMQEKSTNATRSYPMTESSCTFALSPYSAWLALVGANRSTMMCILLPRRCLHHGSNTYAF